MLSVVINRWIKRIASVGLVVGVGYLVLVTCVLRPDEFVLVPRTEPIACGASRQIVTMEDGAQVELFGIEVQDPVGFMLRFPGNDVRAEEIVDRTGKRWGDRMETWAANYPGSGGTSGPARLSRLGPAALAAFDAVARRANGKPVYLDGNSLGATVALYVAAHRSAAGVMLQNPPPIAELARVRFRGPALWLLAWPVSLQIPDALDPVRSARLCRAPAVFIRATEDRDVPEHFQDEIVRAYAGPVHEFQLPGDHDTRPESDPQLLSQAVNCLVSARRAAIQ